MTQAEILANALPKDASADLFAAFVRVFLAAMGLALIVAAFGLWLVPGAGGQAALSLFKLGISLFLLLTGLCLMAFATQKKTENPA